MDNEKIRNESVVNRVYSDLRLAILEQNMKPGDKIMVRQIAQKLNIDRTLIREAVKQLEHEGLVKNELNRGIVVSALTPRDVWEVYSIRAALEGLAARLAAKRISPAEIAELELCLDKMEQAMEEKQYLLMEPIHKKFHRGIVVAARSSRLKEIVFEVSDYITMFTRIGYNFPDRRCKASYEHRDLLEAIKMGDYNKAEQIARKHNERSFEAYYRTLSQS